MDGTFSAAAGLPTGAPQIVMSQFSSSSPIKSYKGPVPQAWTDYCLVMGGHWVYNPVTQPVLPIPTSGLCQEYWSFTAHPLNVRLLPAPFLSNGRTSRVEFGSAKIPC
eukprot:11352319-Heterocapsa_arctica.AAC.1